MGIFLTSTSTTIAIHPLSSLILMTVNLILPSIPIVIRRACKRTLLMGKISLATGRPSLLKALIRIVAPPLLDKHCLLRPSGR